MNNALAHVVTLEHASDKDLLRHLQSLFITHAQYCYLKKDFISVLPPQFWLCKLGHGGMIWGLRSMVVAILR